MYLAQRNEQLHAFPVPREVETFDILAASHTAQERFTPAIIETDLERSEQLSHGSNQVFIKRADALPTGSFKLLSASNSVATHREHGYDEFAFGTAGSFGQAIVEAIGNYGGSPTGFVPIGTNSELITDMQKGGVEVIEVGTNVDTALLRAAEHAKQHGIPLIHPFGSLTNIAATAILGLQIAEQNPDLTDVVLQYGGGSLATGVGWVLQKVRPDVHVTMVQVEGCSPLVDSVRTGTVQEAVDYVFPKGRSFLSGLGGVGVGKLHPLTLGIASHLADSVEIVTTTEVHATMHEFGEVDGKVPGFAAAVGLTYAGKLARSRGVSEAQIIAIHTGGRPDTYHPSYLAARSARRQRDESYRRVGQL